MSGINLGDVRIGDAFEVLFPHTPRPRNKLLGMVVEHDGDSVDLHSIVVGRDGKPLDDTTIVLQRSLSLPEGHINRRILRPMPAFRHWADNPKALLSFSEEQPAIHRGMTLDELLRHADGQFLLTGSPSGEPNAARLRAPFYDHKGGRIVSQHVTVFQLAGGARMERLFTSPGGRDYTLRLPARATYAKVGAGPVLRSTGDRLWLAEPQEGHFSLGHDDLFAVETKALIHAGINPDAI